MLKELNKDLQQSEVHFFPLGSPWLCFPRRRLLFLLVALRASYCYLFGVRRFFHGTAFAVKAPPPRHGPVFPSPVFSRLIYAAVSSLALLGSCCRAGDLSALRSLVCMHSNIILVWPLSSCTRVFECFCPSRQLFDEPSLSPLISPPQELIVPTL